MNNSKIVQVLKSLSQGELREFEKFTASPYFSRGRDLTVLLSELKKFYPEFNHKNFTRENIAAKIGSGRKNSGKDLLKTQASELYKLAREFMTSRALKEFPGFESFLFANSCKKKNLFELAEKDAEDRIRQAEDSAIDWRHYLNNYYLKMEMINLSFSRDMPEKGFKNLNQASEILLHQFLCFSARYIFNLTSLKRTHGKFKQDSILLKFVKEMRPEKLMIELENKSDMYSKASLVYLSFILDVLKGDDEFYYSRFKKYLFENIGIFSEFEKSVFFHYLQNKIQEAMMKKDFNKYAEEFFDIINFRLSKEHPHQYTGASYTAGEYFTAFYSGFLLKKIDWMKRFIDKYSPELDEEHKQPMTNLSIAFLKFSMKDYPDTLNIIATTRGLPFVHNFELKRLQLMALYESGLVNEAFYALDAFKNYLKTNKNVTDDFMRENMSFIGFYRHILKGRLGEEDPDTEKLKIEINSTAPAVKHWLLEKASEL